ncbi:MAG: peptidoglycan DD-metalloendopeptidase family protein [Burkholderiaceae bacterium]
MLSELKWSGVLVGVATLLLAGCASTYNHAPVEDRSPTANKAPVVVAVPAAVPASAPAANDLNKPLPGAENAGKVGYYSVKPGDTLIRIGLENGQNWKDLSKWNNLENPSIIEVGQVLRVIAPGLDANAALTKGVTTARVETRPLDAKGAASPASGAASSTSAPATPPASVAAAAAPAPAPAPLPAAARDAEDDVNWAWPATGAVTAPFDEGKAKGLSIGGKAGDPVFAAADGRVVYAGSGLRGYGNLIILKHNNTYLTAYAHNQALLVKEDQAVRRGQKIAEMGSSDADGVKLHFEIRKQGKPVDPARLLPPR